MRPERSLLHLRYSVTCSYHKPDQSASLTHPGSSRYISVLSSYVGLGITSGLCPLHLPTKTLYTTLLSPICATYSAHFILLDLIS